MREVAGAREVKLAVELYRELARDDSGETHLPNLAGALNNLAIDLGHIGEVASALAHQREAVTVSRQLVERDEDKYLAYLAGSLMNLAALEVEEEGGSTATAIDLEREARGVSRLGFDAASFFEKDADYVEALPGRAA